MDDETNTTETEETTTETEATSDDSSATSEEVPAWAQNLVKSVEDINGRVGLLGKDLGKVRERVKKGSEGATPEKPDGKEETPSLSREDLSAAMKLGSVLAKIPDGAREEIEQAVDAGDLSYGAALDRARFLQQHLPATGSDTKNEAPKAPKGKPATGARSDGEAEISTWAQYQAARKKNPARVKEMVRKGEIQIAELKGPRPRQKHPLEA